MKCDACAAAEARVLSGLFNMHCRDCRVRWCALQPAARRHAIYEQIEDQEAREQFVKDVQAYWKRRQAARQAQQ